MSTDPHIAYAEAVVAVDAIICDSCGYPGEHPDNDDPETLLGTARLKPEEMRNLMVDAYLAGQASAS
jgi:hypothetical protein